MTLVLGGARSGKSRFAEALVEKAGRPALYLATAEAHDEEMRARIAAHRGRRGSNWTTVEEPLELVNILLAEETRPVLIDCLTLWLANLMGAERDIGFEIARLLSALPRLKAPVVMVANEVGLGIVPENANGARIPRSGRAPQPGHRERWRSTSSSWRRGCRSLSKRRR